jgi:hypothetical protein
VTNSFNKINWDSFVDYGSPDTTLSVDKIVINTTGTYRFNVTANIVGNGLPTDVAQFYLIDGDSEAILSRPITLWSNSVGAGGALVIEFNVTATDSVAVGLINGGGASWTLGGTSYAELLITRIA